MIYDNTPDSYSNFTSWEVMQQISHDMHLGFATNEEYTNDRMTWIKPLVKKSNFLEHVLTYSFKDDNSFYDGFIDIFYHMNFLNVADMLIEDNDFDKFFEKVVTHAELKDKQSDTVTDDSPTGDLFLSNWSKLGESDMRITSFKPITRQGEQLMYSGYIRNVGYYDVGLDKDYKNKFIELDVKPISSALIPGKYRSNQSLDIMSKNTNGEWSGIDYNNAHDNYNYAQIQNEHNIGEISKIQLYVQTMGINLNVARGMRIPVIIMLEGRDSAAMMNADISPDELAANTHAAEEEAMQIWYDKYLSGWYYVSSVSYTYDMDEGGFTTEFLLSRSNWSSHEPELFKKT